MLVLVGKGVIKFRTRSPKKFDAQFPSRLRFGIELLRLELELLKKMPRKNRGRSFAHANDPDIRAAQNRDLELRQPALQRNGRDEPGTATAKNGDVLDGRFRHCA